MSTPNNPGNNQPGQPQQPWPYGQPSASQPSASQPSANQPPAGWQPQAPYGQQQGVPGQTPYGQSPYGQAPGQPGYGQPGQSAPQGQPGWGAQPQGPFAPGAQVPGQQAQQAPLNGQGPRPTQFAGQPGRPGQPGTPFGAPQPSGGNKKNLAIIGGIVGLLLVALVVGLLNLGKKDKDPAPTSPSTTASAPAGGQSSAAGEASAAESGSSEAPAQTTTADLSSPEAAAKSFFDALVAGDYDTLKSVMKEEPRDATFITAEVIKQAAAKKAITNVQVTPPAKDYDPVVVKYTVAGKNVSEKVYPIKEASGDQYKIMYSPRSTYLGSSLSSSLNIKLNGVAVTGDTAYLMPGVYDVTTDSPWYDLSSKTITMAGDSSVDSNLKPVLKKDVDAKIKATAKTQLASCIKGIKDFASAKACGLDMGTTGYDGTKWDTKFLQCQVSGGESTIDRAVLKPDYKDVLLLDADVAVKVKCNAKAEKTGTPGSGEVTIMQMNVDLSGKAPKITFERY